VLTNRLWSFFALALMFLLLATPAVFADGEGAYGAGALIGLLCCGGIGLAIQIYILYFMYTDAEARGQSGVMWLLIGFFLGLIGLIVWLIIRPEKKA
jgi:hypothetical protein